MVEYESKLQHSTRVGLVNRSEAPVKIGFVDTVNRLTALVINLETNTV